MAKITAVGLTKDDVSGMWLRVYVVSEDGAIRPANRKDANKRCVTTVKSVERVEGTRLYRVVVGMGEMIVQGSQWFDIVDTDAADEPPAMVPAIEATPDVDTYVADESAEDEVRGLLDRIAELTVENAKLYERIVSVETEQGFSLVVDQVGILHASYEGEPTITCDTPIRSVSVVATGVQQLHPGRKVCPKCERKVRERAA
jgi:hypothetical protein